MSERCPTCGSTGYARPKRKRADPMRFLAELYPGSVTAIIGAPRSGKTRFAQAADAAGLFPRRVVCDTYAHRDRIEASRGKKVSPWSGELLTPAELLAAVSNGEKVLDQDPLDLVVGLTARTEAKLGKQFAAVAEAVWNTGDIDLIPEEIGRYGRYATDLINQVSSGGGHAGVRLIVICQSLTRIPKDCRRCISHIVAFNQAEEGDIEALRKRCGRAFAAEVQALRKGDSPLTWRQGDAH